MMNKKCNRNVFGNVDKHFFYQTTGILLEVNENIFGISGNAILKRMWVHFLK
jgi:hypothetical protein